MVFALLHLLLPVKAAPQLLQNVLWLVKVAVTSASTSAAVKSNVCIETCLPHVYVSLLGNELSACCSCMLDMQRDGAPVPAMMVST